MESDQLQQLVKMVGGQEVGQLGKLWGKICSALINLLQQFAWLGGHLYEPSHFASGPLE